MWQLSDLLSTDIERLGNPGWNWKNLDASMKKLEGYACFSRLCFLRYSWPYRYIAPTKEIAEKQGLKVETWNHGTSGRTHVIVRLDQRLSGAVLFNRHSLPLLPGPFHGRGQGYPRRIYTSMYLIRALTYPVS